MEPSTYPRGTPWHLHTDQECIASWLDFESSLAISEDEGDARMFKEIHRSRRLDRCLTARRWSSTDSCFQHPRFEIRGAAYSVIVTAGRGDKENGHRATRELSQAIANEFEGKGESVNLDSVVIFVGKEFHFPFIHWMSVCVLPVLDCATPAHGPTLLKSFSTPPSSDRPSQ